MPEIGGHDESGARHHRGSENVPILWVVHHPIQKFLVSRDDTAICPFLGRESVLDQVAPYLREDVVSPARMVKPCLRRPQEGVAKNAWDEHRSIQQRIEHVRFVSPYRATSVRSWSLRR